MAILNENTVEVTRSFHAPAHQVFEAIATGVLFRTCGAVPDSIRLDVRVGGKWSVIFSPNIPCGGEFLEVVPNQKLRFTWDGESIVTISLLESNGTTKMHLLHEGLANLERTKDVDWGWRDGVNDFTPQLTRSLKIIREFSAPVEELYALCAQPAFFTRTGAVLSSGSADFRVGGKYSYKIQGSVEGDFIEGEFTDLVPNKRVAFTWSSLCSAGPTGETLVLIDFSRIEQNRTRITLTHAGFPNEQSKKDHEEGWTDILTKLK